MGSTLSFHCVEVICVAQFQNYESPGFRVDVILLFTSCEKFPDIKTCIYDELQSAVLYISINGRETTKMMCFTSF